MRHSVDAAAIGAVTDGFTLGAQGTASGKLPARLQ
jgi:hypothetical protein